MIEKAIAVRSADALQIAPSCSLIHTPVDVDGETKLDPELKGWMAFAKQKLAEIATLATARANGKQATETAFLESYKAIKSRDASVRIHQPEVAERAATVSARDLARRSPFEDRRKKQRSSISLPLFPTTTIGSFPQTAEVRKARAAHRRVNSTMPLTTHS